MKNLSIGVIGNPNCGKTTLFNKLTGAKQKVGNWPGVTVERKEGELNYQGHKYKIIDLPGTYSLDSDKGTVSLDEQIAREFVLNYEADIIINILDASNLQRNLYLTSQLLDMDIPVICAINMIDVAERDGISLDTLALSETLGVPVIPLVASKGQGVDQLCASIHTLLKKTEHSYHPLPIRPDISRAIYELIQLDTHNDHAYWQALQNLESTNLNDSHPKVHKKAQALRKSLEEADGQPIDIIIANARYDAIATLLEQVITNQTRKKSITEKIDQWLLNRWLGIPFFFAVMYLMFVFAIHLGGAFIDFFDQASATLFIDGTKEVLYTLNAPTWLVTLMADGIGGGIQLVATFIPIIAGLYLFLSIIEDTGYMARAAFVMDRFMRAIGLPGKAFVPLIVGFGCNVPAVMAARTMDTEKDRLLTIAMAPFMSCGARLSVYALFAAAFFPEYGASIIFGLYLFGIAMAVLTGLVMKSTLFTSELTPFVMELPAYHVPTLKGVLLKTWNKLESFILKAGKTIVLVVVVLSFLNSWGTDGSFGNENNENSILSSMAKSVTPILSPLGIREDNWPATVGIITGLFAKEAVVGTLDALYSTPDEEEQEFDLATGLWLALKTIPENLSELAGGLLDPLGLSIIGADQTEEQGVQDSTFKKMSLLFSDSWAAIAYLILILLYAPCIATLGAMVREAGIKWMLFITGWTTVLAYCCAVIFYQSSQLQEAPLSASIWMLLCLIFILLCFWAMKIHGQRRQTKLIPIIHTD